MKISYLHNGFFNRGSVREERDVKSFIEDAFYRSDSPNETGKILARLVDVLTSKGQITAQEIIYIANVSPDKDAMLIEE